LFGIAVVFAWRQPQKVPSGLGRERMLPALRAGTRYVRHSPAARRLLLRLTLFVTPAVALWALLPVVASRRLGLGPSGYGLLLGAIWGAVAERAGIGAALVIAGLVLAAGAATIRRWPIYDTSGLDRSPAIYWPMPTLLIDPDSTEGPVLVVLRYTVSPQNHAA